MQPSLFVDPLVNRSRFIDDSRVCLIFVLCFYRGDKTPLELFLAGVRSWAGGSQRPCARLIWKLRASSGQWLLTLAGADSGKSVSTPCLAANAVMDEEKSVGIVFLLHSRQPGIVRPPK